MAYWNFTYTGASESFTVTSSGYYWLYVWGGGGGGGSYNGNAEYGGAGACLELYLYLNAGDELRFEVGQGGGPGSPNVAPLSGGEGGWPDGGWGALGDLRAGGGGGSTRVYLNSVLVAVAGAGGGTSGYSGGGDGGWGGDPVGGNSQTLSGGSGGTQSEGGFDRNDPGSLPKRGGFLEGGLGSNAPDRFTSTGDDGAGGGGGYYGGGGGGGDGHSGGGGSSWVDPSAVETFTYLGSPRPTMPPGNTFPFYIAGVAVGGRAGAGATGGTRGGPGHAYLTDTNPDPGRYVTASKAYALSEIRVVSLASATTNIVQEINFASASLLRVYTVLRPSPPEIHVPAAAAYVLLDGSVPEDAEQMLSEGLAYAVLYDDPERYQYVNKAGAYVLLEGQFRLGEAKVYPVLNDPTPRSVDFGKGSAYAVMGPATGRIPKVAAYALLDNTPHPEQRLTHATAYAVLDVLYPRIFASDFLVEAVKEGDPSVQASLLVSEVTRRGTPDVYATDFGTEVVRGGLPDVLCSHIGIEVVFRPLEEPYMIDPETHTFPSQARLPGLTFNTKKAPEFMTRVAGNTSGREVRNAFWDTPRWNFDHSYELLRDYPTSQVQSELKQIEGFFLRMRGKYESWLFRDPDDFQANNLQALTDGVTLTFPLRRDFGGFNERIGQIDLVQDKDFWFRVGEDGEDRTVPASPGPYTVTATNAAQYRQNVKVTLADGTELAKVDIAPGPMQYTVNAVTGVYAFNADQAGASIKLFYEFDIDSEDYQIRMPNKISFGVAPPAGLELWAKFQFYFVCRFDEDSHEYEKFMDKLWELQQCTFKSLIP